MKSLWVLVFILSVCVGQAHAKEYTYHYFKESTGEVREKHFLEIKRLKKGHMEIKREVQSADKALEEEMVVDENGATLSWEVEDEKEDTKYKGERQGNTLILKGRHKGAVLDKEVELDNKPFYFTPKFNLMRFAASEAEQVRFWMLRKDELTKYLMQAKKKAVETIIVNGKEVEAIKVYYSATGAGEKFYKRTYYFRKSDGLFLKKKAPKKAKSLTAELIL